MSATLLILPIFLGWLAGIIINYLADVLPIARHLSRPACPQCGAAFTWKDYLLFQACPNGHKRKPRIWIVQIVLLAISIYTWLQPSLKIGYGLGLLLIAYFGLVFVIDMEHRLILHPTSIFGALLGLVVGFISNGPGSTLLGGLGGFLIMLALYYFGVLFSRLRANRLRARGREADDEEALGAGDVILAAILGFILGWPLVWFSLLLGIMLGGVFGLLLLFFLLSVRKYRENVFMVFMPYGPSFILSAFLIIFLPNWIINILPK